MLSDMLPAQATATHGKPLEKGHYSNSRTMPQIQFLRLSSMGYIYSLTRQVNMSPSGIGSPHSFCALSLFWIVFYELLPYRYLTNNLRDRSPFGLKTLDPDPEPDRYSA
jgi:hypothetical protein